MAEPSGLPSHLDWSPRQVCGPMCSCSCGSRPLSAPLFPSLSPFTLPGLCTCTSIFGGWGRSTGLTACLMLDSAQSPFLGEASFTTLAKVYPHIDSPATFCSRSWQAVAHLTLPNLGHHLFSYGLQAKNGLLYFSMVRKKLKQ